VHTISLPSPLIARLERLAVITEEVLAFQGFLVEASQIPIIHFVRPMIFLALSQTIVLLLA